MKTIKWNRVWQIVYPLLIYYFVYNLITVVLYMYFGQKYGTLFCLMISAVITLIPIGSFYKNLPVIKDKTAFRDIRAKDVLIDLACVAAIIILALSLNYLMGKTGLTGESARFIKSQKNLYDGSLQIKILAHAIFIPILEEVLFRGIIAGQLFVWQGVLPAVLASSILFGAMHFNIVQFLYAFLVGLALGFLYCKRNKLILCIMAHCMTNLIVIIVTSGILGE